jgi:phosphatidate cytidylyltransferase
VSPTIALHDPTFRRYILLAVAALVAGGVVLLVFHVALKRNVRSAWLTYGSWLVMVPLMAVTVFLGREAVIIGVAVLGVFGFKEFARATGLYGDWWITGVVYLLILAAAVATLANAWHTFAALPVIGVAAIFLVPILRNCTKDQLQSVALAVLGFMLVGWMLGHLGWLTRTREPYGAVIFVVFATEFCDVSAYVGGKMLGHRKFRSAISPNKTWGGSLTAFGVGMAMPWMLAFSFPHFGVREKLLAGLIIGVGGQLGDLAVSVIKRDLGIKDMGAVLPGHGGILDRVDSLLFVAPTFLHLLRWAER